MHLSWGRAVKAKVFSSTCTADAWRHIEALAMGKIPSKARNQNQVKQLHLATQQPPQHRCWGVHKQYDNTSCCWARKVLAAATRTLSARFISMIQVKIPNGKL
jgi:hypothetical protein